MKTNDSSDKYSSNDTLPLKSEEENKNQEKNYFDKDQAEFFDELKGEKWFVGNEKGEKEMLNTESKYGNLKLSFEFTEFIEKLANENNSSESEVVKMGLTLLKLAKKIKNDGLKLAVIDDNGTLLSTIDY